MKIIHYEAKNAEEFMDMMLSGLKQAVEEAKASKTLKLNPVKFSAAMTAITKVVDIVKEENPDAEYEVTFDPLFGTELDVTIRDYVIDVRNIKGFLSALDGASVISFSPEGDKINIGFSFQDIRTLEDKEAK